MSALIITASVLGYVVGWLTTAWIIAPAIVDTDRCNLQSEDYALASFIALAWPVLLVLVPFWAAGHLLKAVTR